MLLVMEHFMSDKYTKLQQETLLKLALDSIQYGVKHHKVMSINLDNYAENLTKPRATFVTLEIAGKLRGCIGSLIAHQPLAQDIVHNAYAAAFEDPRFPPVTEDEVEQLEIHISILDTPKPMSFTSEEDLIKQIRPNIDGLILSDKGYRGTFLPSVWESLPDREDFLKHLKMKAGLPVDYWSDTLKVEKYTVFYIG